MRLTTGFGQRINTGITGEFGTPSADHSHGAGGSGSARRTDVPATLAGLVDRPPSPASFKAGSPRPPASDSPAPARRPTRQELTATKHLLNNREQNWTLADLSSFAQRNGVQPLEKFVDAQGHAKGRGKLIKATDKLSGDVPVAVAGALLAPVTLGASVFGAIRFGQRHNERRLHENLTNVFRPLPAMNRSQALEDVVLPPPLYKDAGKDQLKSSGPPVGYADLVVPQVSPSHETNVHSNQPVNAPPIGSEDAATYLLNELRRIEER